MVFIDIAYAVTVPFLLLITWLGALRWKRYALSLLAVSNLLLILHSIFLIRQIAGVVLLAKKVTAQLEFPSYTIPYELNGYTAGLCLTILLPMVFFFRAWRTSQWITLCMLLLVYWNNPVTLWHTYDLFFNILNYLCLLCAGYALLWLRNALPRSHKNNDDVFANKTGS